MGVATIPGVFRLARAFTRAALKMTDGNGMARTEGMQGRTPGASAGVSFFVQGRRGTEARRAFARRDCTMSGRWKKVAAWSAYSFLFAKHCGCRLSNSLLSKRVETWASGSPLGIQLLPFIFYSTIRSSFAILSMAISESG